MTICVECKQTRPDTVWPVCPNNEMHCVVHVGTCTICKVSKIGYVIDDDYCGPEKLVCPSCLGRI